MVNAESKQHAPPARQIRESSAMSFLWPVCSGGWATLPGVRSDSFKSFRVAHPSRFEGCGVLNFRMSMEG